eukprot:COSAG02_NODE_98_length_37150_cov_39.614207_22_plen_53_part_00
MVAALPPDAVSIYSQLSFDRRALSQAKLSHVNTYENCHPQTLRRLEIGLIAF